MLFSAVQGQCFEGLMIRTFGIIFSSMLIWRKKNQSRAFEKRREKRKQAEQEFDDFFKVQIVDINGVNSVSEVTCIFDSLLNECRVDRLASPVVSANDCDDVWLNPNNNSGDNVRLQLDSKLGLNCCLMNARSVCNMFWSYTTFCLPICTTLYLWLKHGWRINIQMARLLGSNSNYSVAAPMDRSDKIGGGTLAIVKNKHSFMQCFSCRKKGAGTHLYLS